MRDSNELFAHYVDSYFTRALCSPQSRHNHNIPNFVFHSTTCKYTLKIFRNFGCNGKMFTEHCRCRATVIALCELKSGVNGRKSQIRGDKKILLFVCYNNSYREWHGVRTESILFQAFYMIFILNFSHMLNSTNIFARELVCWKTFVNFIMTNKSKSSLKRSSNYNL